MNWRETVFRSSTINFDRGTRKSITRIFRARVPRISSAEHCTLELLLYITQKIMLIIESLHSMDSTTKPHSQLVFKSDTIKSNKSELNFAAASPSSPSGLRSSLNLSQTLASLFSITAGSHFILHHRRDRHARHHTEAEPIFVCII